MSAPADWPPPGYVLVWRPDPGWRVLPPVTKRCRMPRCLNWAVAELNRGLSVQGRVVQGRVVQGRVDCWWAYCAAYLYGRRVRSDVVEYQALQPAEDV